MKEHHQYSGKWGFADVQNQLHMSKRTNMSPIVHNDVLRYGH